MRLAHAVFGVALLALTLSILRDPVGRVCLIVLVTGLGEVVFGLAGVMGLFQTVGAIGEARTLTAHVEAVVETTFVLALATVAMTGWLFIGAWAVSIAV
jgi:hypothetical protein